MKLTRLFLMLGLSFALSSNAIGQGGRPSIYVGPQVRDGFVDMDSGIRDSIGDLKQELASGGFRVMPMPEGATLTLIVLGRGVVSNGSVGSFVGGLGVVAPHTTPTLSTILRVGTYERLMQSEGTTWTRAAKTAVEDVLAWWQANAATVETRRAQQ